MRVLSFFGEKIAELLVDVRALEKRCSFVLGLAGYWFNLLFFILFVLRAAVRTAV
jgi:hypothetical protein